MCLFCEKEDIERESIEKKEKLDNVLKIADKLIKQKNIKDVRESPVYSLIRAISNLHLYDIVRELYEGAYCEAKRPDLRSETVAFRF